MDTKKRSEETETAFCVTSPSKWSGLLHRVGCPGLSLSVGSMTEAAWWSRCPLALPPAPRRPRAPPWRVALRCLRSSWSRIVSPRPAEVRVGPESSAAHVQPDPPHGRQAMGGRHLRRPAPGTSRGVLSAQSIPRTSQGYGRVVVDLVSVSRRTLLSQPLPPTALGEAMARGRPLLTDGPSCCPAQESARGHSTGGATP